MSSEIDASAVGETPETQAAPASEKRAIEKAASEIVRDAEYIRAAQIVRDAEYLTQADAEADSDASPGPDACALPVIQRPRTRGDCADVPRPCPFVSCRYNLYLDVTARQVIQLSHPDLEPEAMKERNSCVLDVAERGPLSLERIGALLGLTRERVRQIEIQALRKLNENARELSRHVSQDGEPLRRYPKVVPLELEDEDLD